MKVLCVLAGRRAKASDSRERAHRILDELKAANADVQVSVRDLLQEPLPHLGEEQVVAFFKEPGSLTHQEREALRLSDRCVSELLVADILIIATPMWNFSVPSALKAWVDHVVRVGLTFEMSAEGPRGLLRNKKAIIVTSAGGLYAQGPLEGWDACGGYLKNLLHFLGVSEVEWIRSEGRAMPGAERVIRALV